MEKYNMDQEQLAYDNRLQNALKHLAKCKIDFTNENEECKRIREANSKLELELRQVRELEQSHRNHLMVSREMIGNLQETVSQLIYLKGEISKLKDQISLKDASIADLETQKEHLLQKYNESTVTLRNSYEQQIEEMKTENNKNIQQMQHECDAQVAQFTCVIEELGAKLTDMETENREKINIVVLEYEEKIQREAAQVNQLQEQLARSSAQHDLNTEAYRRRLEELEEKLKQSQFKQYLAQNVYPSQYENHVERPYSSTQHPYSETYHTGTIAAQSPKLTFGKPQNNAPKSTNALHVMHRDSKSPKEKPIKKGLFHINKKRKLYSDKDFQDF